MADPEEDTNIEKPKSNKMMIIIVAVNVVAAAGIGGFLFLGGSSSAGEAAEAPPPVALNDPPVTAPLDPFVVNLYEPGGTRYLKIVIEAEVPGEMGIEIITTNNASIRNQIISYLSGLTFADTQGPEQKGIIQKELVKQINEVLRREIVRNIYFTEFIIQ